MSPRGIEFGGVTFAYEPGTLVLQDVDLRIPPGVTLVLGPNGSGKSTLLKIAAGVEKPDAGSVRVDGHDLWADELEARRNLAYVPEEPDVTPYASVQEVLHLVCRLRREPLDRAAEAAARAGLEGLGRRSIRQLSKGQRRRALLAAAWIGTPTTLILDEPLEALDLPTRDHLLGWLARTTSDGGQALIATHDLPELSPLAAHAITLQGTGARLHPTLPQDPATRLRLLTHLATGHP